MRILNFIFDLNFKLQLISRFMYVTVTEPLLFLDRFLTVHKRSKNGHGYSRNGTGSVMETNIKRRSTVP
jgi:hypothetical protein